MQDFIENNQKIPQLSMEIKRTHVLLVTKSQDCGEPNNLFYI